MTMPKDITTTQDGGFYYRAIAFRYALTYPALPLVLLALVVAVINPLWFRDDFFRYIERKINQFAQWRNYKQYAIYLGTDPKIWHTLKD